VADPASWRLRDDPLLAPIVVMIATSIGAVSLTNVVEVFFVRGVLHASPTVFGLLMSVWTATMIVGGWLLARRKLHDGALGTAMTVMLATTCAVLAGAAGVPSAGWLFGLWIVGGLANGGLNTVAGVLLGRRVPAQARGRAQARVGAAISGANLFGFALGGVLLSLATPRVLLLAAGLAGFAVVVVFAPRVHRAGRRYGGQS